MALTPAQGRRLTAAEEAMADLRRSVAELISSLITSGRLEPTEDLLAKIKREGLPMPEVPR
ncbi:MAG: hypothetical protein ACLGI8_07055 [Acidimicrobiia bacterium]